MKKFSKIEILKFSWNIFKNNIEFLIKLSLIIILIEFIIGIPLLFKNKTQFNNLSLIVLIIQSIISFIWFVIQQIGLSKISLDLCYYQKSKLSELFYHYRLFFKFLIGTTLYWLIVLVGILLFIIPGIIWAIKFQFYPYLIIEKGLNPIQALKRSSQITKGSKWDLFIFTLMIFGITLGIMLIGLIIIFLLFFLFLAIYYLLLKINFVILAMWFLILILIVLLLTLFIYITIIPIALLIPYACIYSKLITQTENNILEH